MYRYVIACGGPRALGGAAGAGAASQASSKERTVYSKGFPSTVREFLLQ